jgi:cytidine deaminase
MTIHLTNKDQEVLKKRAIEAATQAYAPYSGIKVGASVFTTNGHVFVGSNVENASYGLTICAERSAIFAAVSSEGPGMRLQGIAIYCADDIACAPCGACRQVISEFADDIPVIYSCGGAWRQTSSRALLPESFRIEPE